MASLKALKMRITSVKSTQKITKAMKMVAAAKLRRAQEAAEAARPYSERMAAVMASLGATVQVGPESPRLLAGTGADQVHLLVIASSERGLAGGFNTNIARLARKKMEALLAQGKTVKLLFVGKKARAPFMRTHKQLIIGTIDQTHIKNVAFADAKAIADDITARFDAGEFDVAHLFFARFRSALVQEPTELQIIPAALPAAAVVEAKPSDAAPAAVEYEPDEEAILAELLPRNLSVQIFRALLENAASEQGSRMTAMDNATRNAGDMINKLTITYNRTRQAAITKELIEIISGAEAL
ncbi:F0F1 ATP synthase subunit gamma [Polymorphobacter fuscus]|uniref:ATP synthase gamma chain n=1 Tax=Sandarakinorhabdus fusca TaxID=1439888 RepID=A0A7C9GY90_9SPHN|nr:F0F1 ATP synthase subunit gamma [Polymorphobacter fuscus]KAB7646546.1 F0F1 ATP synthase subunit gamma [Polymorphobacter fuscus]MQT17794.1 F0F1 ATP synthase subunit gamma [Polymorphobacter fuscus]NJC09658.1 F-type H+-transporting ATPase subunit gamma [Polymorphobacter fuscus]